MFNAALCDLTVLFGNEEIPAWSYRGFGQIQLQVSNPIPSNLNPKPKPEPLNPKLTVGKPMRVCYDLAMVSTRTLAQAGTASRSEKWFRV